MFMIVLVKDDEDNNTDCKNQKYINVKEGEELTLTSPADQS